MALDSFRELLIKRSEDPDLVTLIQFMREDALTDIIYESLEKMATAKHKGSKANAATRHFATEMDPDHGPQMIHDALGHHVSRYKKAIEGGRQDLANQHAKQAFRIINMSSQAKGHSGGKLDIDAPDIKAWERHGKQNKYTADDAKVKSGDYKVGDYKTKTKGFNYPGKDFSWLQKDPHESYSKETAVSGHSGPYPFEKTRVNGKNIVVDNDVDLRGYQEHEFDSHPIMNHYEEAAKKRTPEREKEYRDAHDSYEDGSSMDSYLGRHEKMLEDNPEDYSRRGTFEGSPVHGDSNKNVMDLGFNKPEKPTVDDVDGSKLSPAMQEIMRRQKKPE